MECTLSKTGTSSSNRKDIRSELPISVLQLWESFQPTLIPQTPVLIRAYSNGYTYGNDGYIRQDSLSPQDMTAILYLNKDWNANYAGETAIFDSVSGEIVQSVLPKWRRLLIFPSNMYHVGRGVSRICPHLRQVLVFKARPEQEERSDPSRESLEKFLADSSCKTLLGGRKIEIFIESYNRLRSWNATSSVSFVGALYPLYERDIQLSASFDDIRSKIIREFGEETDRLSQLFGTIDLARLISEGVAVNKSDGTELTLAPPDKQQLLLIYAAIQA